MARVDYQLLVVDKTGSTVLCDPIGVGSPALGKPGYSEITLGPRHLEVGFGQVTVTPNPDLIDAVNTPDARIVAVRDSDEADTRIAMSGPIESQPLGYAAERDGTDGPGTLTVRFADDLAQLADVNVYPDPANASTAQTVAKYAISNANPEDAIRTLINLNCGPGAIAARQISGLTLGPDLGLMSGVLVSTSFTRATALMDAIREVSRLAGGNGLGVSAVQLMGTGTLVSVYQPTDRTSTVWYGRDFGNVLTLNFEPTAPTCTVAIVGDETAGPARIIRERVNTAAHAAGWRRRELFVDGRSAANLTELDQLGDKALADGAPKYTVSITAKETPDQQYGLHVLPGDLVSVVIASGLVLEQVCAGADIKVTPDRGEVVTPLIGVDPAVLADGKATELRRIYQRLAAIEGAL